MPLAIISDIHANLEALEAVLAQIESQGITEIICLGDIVGYGPDPLACIDLVREKCQIVLEGNHEEHVKYKLNNESYSMTGSMSSHALQTDLFAYNQIMGLKDPKKGQITDFFKALPNFKEDKDRYYVHGSPSDKTWGYVIPRGISNSDIQAILAKRKIVLLGHTHMPYVIYEDGVYDSVKKDVESFSIDRNGLILGKKAIVGVGSVGQPRDGIPKACYVVLDEDGIQFHRVQYDYSITQKKVMAMDKVAHSIRQSLARRLETG